MSDVLWPIVRGIVTRIGCSVITVIIVIIRYLAAISDQACSLRHRTISDIREREEGEKARYKYEKCFLCLLSQDTLTKDKTQEK